MAEINTFWVPNTLIGVNCLQSGKICRKAPVLMQRHEIYNQLQASHIVNASFVSNIANIKLYIGILQSMAHIILFFSSLLKIRISLISESKKRFKTALPKEPVQPVMRKTLLAKRDITNSYYFYIQQKNDHQFLIFLIQNVIFSQRVDF